MRAGCLLNGIALRSGACVSKRGVGLVHYFAHSQNADGNGVCESVAAHTIAVQNYATMFASAFGIESQADAAALLHDLGKYSDQISTSNF